MREDRTLGDVPGLDGLIPNSAVLPTGYTYTEVNPLGEVTADSTMLGDLTNGMGSTDPFAYNIGFLDNPQGGGVEGGDGHVAVHDPMQSSYLPSYDATPAVIPGPVAAGSESTHGKYGSDPYGLTQIDGHTVDNFTAAALKAASKEFGSDFRVIQGSHNPGGVAASGGTHDGGGVVDLAPVDGDWAGALTALRKIGFAAWIRNLPGYGQAGDGAHIHAVLIGDEQLSPEAQTQVQSYLNNDDGLSGSRPDDGPRQYVNNRFVWGPPKKRNEGPTWRDKVTKLARTYLGTPFQWGGKDYSGIDSESLLHNIYGEVGAKLPTMGQELAHLGEPMSISDAKPGDLIGWRDPTEGLKFGIYLSNGQLIEAGGPGRVVQLNELGSDVLNTFGIPIEKLINSPQGQPLSRPAFGTQDSVSTNPGTVSVTTNPATGNSMVEPHASIPGKTKKHKGGSGDPITADDYTNKPPPPGAPGSPF